MISVIITSLLVALFFFSGQVIEAIKKIIGLFVNLIGKLLNLIGIKVHKRESHVRLSSDFKNTYKEIKVVKLSKKNIKQESSIDWVNFGVLIVACILVLINMDFITGNAISNWLCTILPFNMARDSMNTFYTATLFSVMSFAISKILNRWRATKQQRREKRDIRLKEKAIAIMDSKELVDRAKKKDEEKLKELEK